MEAPDPAMREWRRCSRGKEREWMRRKVSQEKYWAAKTRENKLRHEKLPPGWSSLV
jgi:hypothetical protein